MRSYKKICRFLVHILALKLAKNVKVPSNKRFNKIHNTEKSAEFYADFESVEKPSKKKFTKMCSV